MKGSASVLFPITACVYKGWYLPPIYNILDTIPFFFIIWVMPIFSDRPGPVFYLWLNQECVFQWYHCSRRRLSETSLFTNTHNKHYRDVKMGPMMSQITSPIIVYPTVYSSADQRKYRSSASLACVGEFTGDRRIPHTKDQQSGKCFHLMTSSRSCSMTEKVACVTSSLAAILLSHR